MKSESIPHWLLLMLTVGQTALLVAWRLEDTHKPIPDLPFWIGEALISAVVVLAIWWRHQDQNRDPSKLHIFYAHVGWGGWFWQFSNETKNVRAFVKNNALKMPVTGEFFGDAKFGRGKMLTVKYSFAGFIRTVTIPQDRPSYSSTLVLPEPELREKVEQMLRLFPDNKA
jgi:hypothetical protein